MNGATQVNAAIRYPAARRKKNFPNFLTGKKKADAVERQVEDTRLTR
jgi:hypothetical protein